MQYTKVTIKRELLIKGRIQPQVLTKRVQAIKIYSSSDKETKIIQSNPELIKSPTSYQATLSNRPRKKKMVNTSVNPHQEKKSSLKRHQVK